jgi:predicted peptidase
LPEAAVDDRLDELFEARATTLAGEHAREVFSYRLLKPPTETGNRAHPLVLFLHGRDQRGVDNCAQLKYLPGWMAEAKRRRDYPCYLVAPQCRPDRFWVETPRAFDRSLPRQAPGPQMQAVINMLDDVIRDFPVDERRLYLTGLSMGGFGCWDLGTRLAERWAAVAPICGGGDELYADRLVGVPVWAWHGDADDVVPVRKTRRMIEAIHAAGGEPKFTELAGVGHDSWTPAYTGPDGLLPWMFAQRKR